MELTPDLLRPESTVRPDRHLGEGDAQAPDQNEQSITPADRLDAESHFIIAKDDRVIEPQPRSVALGRGLFSISAASLAAHGLILLVLAWFGPAPADRLKETPVEVVVETPTLPKPPQNGAPPPPARKANPNSALEAKTTGANPPESRPPQADPPETRPPAPNTAPAKPSASDPPEAKPEKPKAAPSKTADRNGAAQKQKESGRAERKPPPAQAKAATFERAAATAQDQAAGKNSAKRAANQWSDVGAQSHPPGGVRLPFDNGPEIFRAVAVPLPVEGGDEPLSYKEIVFGLLERAKQYPQTARERGARGSAVVSFVLDDAGELTDVSLVLSSGEADLDAECLALVARAAPFPKPPPGAQRAYAAEITFGLQKAD
jgi:periplasmic protein TonB